jgi:hypothetical protein
MTGNDCYALRSAFLHEGSNIVSGHNHEIVREKFIIMYSEHIYIHKCGTDKLTIFLTDFCIDIINSVEIWLKNIELCSDRTKINKVNQLMKVYLPDVIDSNGRSYGAIINNLEDET